MCRLALSLLALALIAAVPALAQEEPPARVGRVSFVSGQLGFHLAGETAWSKAAVNYPVATGGSFWTDPKSRAELRIGSRAIGLSGDTELDVSKLDQQVMQLALPQGRIDLRVRTLLEGESIEIDLPRGAVWLLQPGVYDIDSGTPDQPERIAVFEGSARFVGGTVDVAINAGDAAVISGTQTLTAATERAAPDDFAKWCRSRDYDERRLAAPYHVSPQMTGYEELDQYGSWRSVPQYGEAWFPQGLASGWAPYREGHWVWVEPWGWSWVDDEPWGFAPFHYGRWAMIDDQWGWVPGDFAPQPVYAPALVAFVGDPGTGYWDAADVGPAVGWFPLGPGEIFWPGYTRDRNYIRNINITNVNATTINQVAGAGGTGRGSADPPPQVRDQHFTNRNATTVVPARTFANADPVAPAARQVPRQVTQQAAQQAPVSVRPPQLKPASARTQATPAAPRGPATAATPTAPAPGHAPAAVAPNAPGIAHAPPAPGTPAAPGTPGIAHAPPAEPHGGAAPSLAHAPPIPPPAPGGTHPATAPGVAHVAPPAAAPPAPAHAAPIQANREPPQIVHGPMRVGPSPQPAHAPPQPAHVAPPQAAPPPQAMHAAPPQAPHAAPPLQVMRAAPPTPPAPRPAPPPPQVVHAAPPPPAPHPAPPPPQVVHAAPPAPPPQVFRGAPPAPPPAPRPAPPAPQIARAPPGPPPAPARPAAPPAPAKAPPGKGQPLDKDEHH